MQTVASPAVPRGAPAGPQPDAPGRAARWFVWAFLAVFVACGLGGIEAWPLSGWRLFSHLRFDHSTTWVAYTVDPGGGERWLPLSRLPGGLSGLQLVMPGLDRRPAALRAGMCAAWVAAARRDGRSGPVRIYRVDRSLEPRDGDRAARGPRRTLVLACPVPGLG